MKMRTSLNRLQLQRGKEETQETKYRLGAFLHSSSKYVGSRHGISPDQQQETKHQFPRSVSRILGVMRLSLLRLRLSQLALGSQLNLQQDWVLSSYLA